MRRALSRTAQPILHGARTPANAHGLRLVIEQWGHTTDWHDISTGFVDSINYPLTFPNVCLEVLINSNGGGYPEAVGHVSSDTGMGTSSFKVTWAEWDSRYVQTIGVNFFAIGY